MIKLSAVVITYNEEERIEACLTSLKKVADEIVVLDSFSTDQTESICQRVGAVFHQQKFAGYIEQKNKAVELAQNDWILSLDADEVLSEKLIQSILAVKENPGYHGYTMNRLNHFMGRPVKTCGWYPDKKLRLFNRSGGRFGGIDPHDVLILEKNEVAGHLLGDLLHYTYNTFEEHKNQNQYFAKIGAQSLKRTGVKISFFAPLLHSLFRFVRDFLLKGGFLEGALGFRICYRSALSSWQKYAWARKKEDS
jgi:glycosyltransferase involved in cell wall biosynthesis